VFSKAVPGAVPAQRFVPRGGLLNLHRRTNAPPSRLPRRATWVGDIQPPLRIRLSSITAFSPRGRAGARRSSATPARPLTASPSRSRPPPALPAARGPAPGPPWCAACSLSMSWLVPPQPDHTGATG